MKKFEKKIVRAKKKISLGSVEIVDKGEPFSTHIKFAGVKLQDVYIITELDYHVDIKDGKGRLTITYYKKG
jgi:hypothetical protein